MNKFCVFCVSNSCISSFVSFMGSSFESCFQMVFTNDLDCSVEGENVSCSVASRLCVVVCGLMCSHSIVSPSLSFLTAMSSKKRERNCIDTYSYLIDGDLMVENEEHNDEETRCSEKGCNLMVFVAYNR